MPMPTPTPGQPPAPGAPPPGAPQLSGAPPMGGTGAATSPRPMMGSAMQSMTLVHTALEALQKSLVGLPMGSELHTAVLKAVTDISKRMDGGQSGDKAAQIQQLAAMGRDMQSNPQAQIMQKMGAQPGAQQPPAMPGA